MIRLNLDLREARLNQIRNAFDAHATLPGYLEIYTGAMPDTAGAAITTQVKLGKVTLSKPCGTMLNAVLTFANILPDVSADATGDLAWVRGFDGGGNFVLDGDAGIFGSGAFFECNRLDVETGGFIAVPTAVISEGNA